MQNRPKKSNNERLFQCLPATSYEWHAVLNGKIVRLNMYYVWYENKLNLHEKQYKKQIEDTHNTMRGKIGEKKTYFR